MKEDGLFQEFDGVVLIVIICYALTGLVVSLMLKYADDILKEFATSAAVVVVTAASMFLFDVSVSFLFFLGVCMVGSAGEMYSYCPHELKVYQTYNTFMVGCYEIPLRERESSSMIDYY
jgi:UDP-sugar transporter A1/2/3